MSDYISRSELLEVMTERKRPLNGEDGSHDRWRYIQWLADYWAVVDAPSVDVKETVGEYEQEILNARRGEE